MKLARTTIITAIAAAAVAMALPVSAGPTPPAPIDNPLRATQDMAAETDGAIHVGLDEAGWVLFEGQMYERIPFEERALAGELGDDVSFVAYPAAVRHGYVYAFRTSDEAAKFEADQERDTAPSRG
jgi:hypothetical protein